MLKNKIKNSPFIKHKIKKLILIEQIKNIMMSLIVKRLAINAAVAPTLFLQRHQPLASLSIPLLYAEKFVKTPTNRAKTWQPSTVPVTRANQHLEVHLTDAANNVELGKVSLGEANRLAKERELRLVITDESTSPPRFQLMTGTELFKLQMTYKGQQKDALKEPGQRVLKEKEVDLNLGIEDHDFDIKMKMVARFYEQGHPVKISIDSKVSNKNVCF
jgi:translation initiation factor IF-3